MLNTKIYGKLAVLYILVVAAVAVLPASGLAQDQLAGRELVDALRRGGYVIYFRHAATDWSQDDQVISAGDWLSCDPGRMRQLSDQGRAAARGIGDAIRRLDIPVGRILSSEYCRTRQTAQLMGLGPVVPTRAIMNMRVADMVGGRQAVIERAQRELGRKPEPGSNTIIVAHGNLMRAASGAYTGEAGAGIYQPLGGRQFTLVAQLEPDMWKALADRFAAK